MGRLVITITVLRQPRSGQGNRRLAPGCSRLRFAAPAGVPIGSTRERRGQKAPVLPRRRSPRTRHVRGLAPALLLTLNASAGAPEQSSFTSILHKLRHEPAQAGTACHGPPARQPHCGKPTHTHTRLHRVYSQLCTGQPSNGTGTSKNLTRSQVLQKHRSKSDAKQSASTFWPCAQLKWLRDRLARCFHLAPRPLREIPRAETSEEPGMKQWPVM